MYHGTSEATAKLIECGGFKPSVSGMLGPGVYCTRDIRKAKQYGAVILTLLVNVGRVKVIELPNERNEQWQSGPFDSAWVKPGVQPSGEEDCIKDLKRVQVLARADPNCVRRAPLINPDMLRAYSPIKPIHSSG
jgi:hypothetical protein